MNSLISRSGLFDDFFRGVAPGYYIKPLHGDPLPGPEQIKMDVTESEKAFTVHAEIPGVKKEDIQVSIEDDVVTLRAESKQADSRKDDKMLRSECYFGSVSRGIQLPQVVDESAAKAEYANGVLTLTLPKKQGKVSKQLRID